MQFTNTLLALLPLASLISAAPIEDAASKKTYIVEVTGLPKEQFPNATYVSYAQNFFGEYALEPTYNKSTALSWTIGSKSDLVSTTKQSISLTPPYQKPQAESINYVAYNGTQGTYVKANKEVVNRSPDWGSWRFCESQYGAGLEYETPGFNNSNAGEPFPCYPVKFVLSN